jgi:phenylpyruvate tautomerase PptA (4-oxalocrotonate tautomerase family)
MPNTRIEIVEGWLGSRKAAFIEAVHQALVAALRIPEHDRTLRLIEHPRENVSLPPGKSERYTLIEITLFAGRSLAAKRQLYRALVQNLEAFGVPAQDVKVALIDVPRENWGIRGGQAACDVDLGFEVAV